MATHTFSRADVLYRRLVRNTFFCQGWGTIDMFKSLQRFKRDMFDAETFKEMVQVDESLKIDKVTKVRDAYSVVDGHFLSPLAKYYPGLLPKESEVAQFQAMIPNNRGQRVPICVMLAGTGDHYFWRRRNLVAKPLLKENSVGSVMLVNPYYGWRRPEAQKGSSLNNVIDLFVMGCALIVETSVLLNWCEQQGFGPLGVTGVSMGGHMASLAGTFVSKPLAIIPCLSWTTASSVFTEGVLSDGVCWSVLEDQLNDFEFLEKICDICNEVEGDGLSARNCHIATTRKDYSPSYPYELLTMNSSNSSMETPFDQHVNYNSNHNQLSVSLEVVAGRQLESFLKTKVLSQIPRYKSRQEKNYEKAKSFMKYVLDITTHLAYYRVPFDPSLAVFVEAEYDGYVPRKKCLSPLDIWPGCQVKYTNCGHIAAALYKQDIFRETISETLNKMS